MSEAPTKLQAAVPTETKHRSTTLQALMYALFAISAGVIEATSFALIEMNTDWSYRWVHVSSLSLSVLYNFTVNRRYTFRSANNVPRAMALVILFYVLFLPTTTYVGGLATDRGVNEVIVKGCTMVCNFVLEFCWWKFVVFHGTEDTNSLARND